MQLNRKGRKGSLRSASQGISTQRVVSDQEFYSNFFALFALFAVKHFLLSADG
jgi:hypothetical protein